MAGRRTPSPRPLPRPLHASRESSPSGTAWRSVQGRPIPPCRLDVDRCFR